MKLIVTLCSLVLLSSCSKITNKILGIKKPRIESTSSIVAFLNGANIDSENVFHLDSVASHTYWRQDYAIMSEFRIYNGNGQLVRRIEKDECSGALATSLETFDFNDFKPVVINPEHLDSILHYFVRIDGKKLMSADFKKTDYVVCMFYMNALGKHMQENLSFMSPPLLKNKDKDNIKVLYLNVDMHDSWKIKSRSDSRRVQF